MLQILKQHTEDLRFGSIIAAALKILEFATIERESGPAMLGQSSRSVAELHAFRKRSGYYIEGKAVGLDETIEALASCDVPVRLGVLEIRQGAIAMWLDERDFPLGVIVFTANSTGSTEPAR